MTAEALTFPEGLEVSDELRDEFLALVNNDELSRADRAAALIDLQAKALTAASEAGSRQWTEMQDKWREEVKADPVVGGDKLEPTLTSIRNLVKEYGSPELVEVFGTTGAGNNVHVIKFLSTLAEKLTEGSFTPGLPASEKSAAQLLFPSAAN